MIYNFQRLKQQLIKNEIDILIASTKENILYLCGFEPVIKTLNPYYGECYAVITIKNPEIIHIVHSIGEVDQVLDSKTLIGRVNTYGTFFREYRENVALTLEEQRLQEWSRIDKAYNTAGKALVNMIGFLSEGKKVCIGYDQDGIPLETLANLKKEFSDNNYLEASRILRFVRRVKTAYEVEMITASAKCNEAAIENVIKNLKEGMSEVDIARSFEGALVEQGAKPSLTMIKIGRDAVGGQRTQKANIKLAPGDLIWFDSDAIFKGFWSDIARVCSFRYVPKDIYRYEALASGMQTAADHIRPGMKGSEIFNLTMKAIHRAGFNSYRRHHVGHGIGLEPYELPILSPHDNTFIEEGMVLSIETPYYEFGFGALHIEDPLLVGSEGNRFLTKNSIPKFIVADSLIIK